jgi:hypothetical protein
MKKIIIYIILVIIFGNLSANEEYGLLKRISAISYGSGFGKSGIPLYVYSDILITKNLYTSPEISFSFFKQNKYSGRAISAAWRFNYYLDDFMNISSKFNSYVGLIIGGEKWLYDYKFRNYFPKSDNNFIKLAIGSRYFFKENLAVSVELISLSTNELRIGLHKRF